MLENINEVAVVVSAILAMAIGSIWYSPLMFGSIWMKSIGLNFENGEMPTKEMIVGTLKGVFVQIVFFAILAQFASWSTSKGISLVHIASLLSVLISVHILSSVIWEKRSIAYFLINAGYTTLVLFGGLGVIAYWPW